MSLDVAERLAPGAFEPGVPEHEYFARPGFSQSAAKALLDCPARYRWERDHPKPPTPAMELGTVVHALALGQPDVHRVIDADSMRSKAAQAAAETARAEGLIPLLPDGLDRARAMAKALRDHPYVGAVLAAQGENELSMWWVDERTGILCKGRIDALRVADDGTHVIGDVKTAAAVAPGRFGRAAADRGYHLQGAAYIDGYRTHYPDALVAYLLAAVESEPPHFVAVYSFTAEQLEAGQRRWEQALDLYRECTETDHWPAYPTEPIALDMPPWAL